MNIEDLSIRFMSFCVTYRDYEDEPQSGYYSVVEKMVKNSTYNDMTVKIIRSYLARVPQERRSDSFRIIAAMLISYEKMKIDEKNNTTV